MHRCPDCTLACECTPGDAVTYHCIHCDDTRPGYEPFEVDDEDPEDSDLEEWEC